MSPAGYQSPWMNDELRMFRKTVRQFIHEQFTPNVARWRAQHRPDVEAWTAAGATGLLLSGMPEAWGGGGGTFAHDAVVTEELARAGVHFSAGLQSIVAHYILAYGTDDQKRRSRPPAPIWAASRRRPARTATTTSSTDRRRSSAAAGTPASFASP
jgi:alkylation response protein AidB-like acyl-CoA dehydrogenase